VAARTVTNFRVFQRSPFSAPSSGPRSLRVGGTSARITKAADLTPTVQGYSLKNCEDRKLISNGTVSVVSAFSAALEECTAPVCWGLGATSDHSHKSDIIGNLFVVREYLEINIASVAHISSERTPRSV